MEIIINGRDIQAIDDAMQTAISAAVGTPGLIRISAGNYEGRLGKNFIYLRADKPGAGDKAAPRPQP
jgi:formylmethanofuran--tetrahydromethanopterin N-formyltransferase